MPPFIRLPHQNRSPAGLEWKVFRRLPWLMMAGAVPLAASYLLPYLAPSVQNPQFQMMQFIAAGIALTTSFATLVVGFGSVLVMVMKGPGFVRDAYRLPRETD